MKKPRGGITLAVMRLMKPQQQTVVFLMKKSPPSFGSEREFTVMEQTTTPPVGRVAKIYNKIKRS